MGKLGIAVVLFLLGGCVAGSGLGKPAVGLPDANGPVYRSLVEVEGEKFPVSLQFRDNDPRQGDFVDQWACYNLVDLTYRRVANSVGIAYHYFVKDWPASLRCTVDSDNEQFTCITSNRVIYWSCRGHGQRATCAYSMERMPPLLTASLD